MKKLFISIILFCFICCTMSGCGRLDEQGKQCLTDLKDGLQNRWDYTNTDYKSYEEYQGNLSKGIDAELTALKKHKDIQFKNEELQNLIIKYTKALDSQKEGISFLFTNIEKYNDLFIEKGLKVRSECIRQLKDNFRFKVDEQYDNNFKSLIECSYTPLKATNEQLVVETKYGKIGISFIDFDVLINPGNEKELVLYCQIENISYSDEYNGESIIVDDFIRVYDGEGNAISSKNESYGYIDGYEECAGFVDLRQGEKGKFAIMFDYTTDIDIIYAVVSGETEAYGCYLTAGDWLPIKEHNYVDGSALTELDSLVEVGKDDEFEKYGNNIWTLIKAKYGSRGMTYFYHDDGDSTGVDDIEGMRTYRNIVLGESSEEDVIKAYGFGETKSFNISTDPLYRTLTYTDNPNYKYLLDAKKTICYDYRGLYQIVFYIDEVGIVDFIAYFDEKWY